MAKPISEAFNGTAGLLCLKKARKGGLSSWTSSLQVVNEMLKRGRKDLVEELAGPNWYLDRKGEIPEGEKPFFQLPILHYHKVGCPAADLFCHSMACPECLFSVTCSKLCSVCMLRAPAHMSKHIICAALQTLPWSCLSCLTSSQDNCLVWCGSLGDIAQPVARNQMAC